MLENKKKEWHFFSLISSDSILFCFFVHCPAPARLPVRWRPEKWHRTGGTQRKSIAKITAVNDVFFYFFLLPRTGPFPKKKSIKKRPVEIVSVTRRRGVAPFFFPFLFSSRRRRRKEIETRPVRQNASGQTFGAFLLRCCCCCCCCCFSFHFRYVYPHQLAPRKSTRFRLVSFDYAHTHWHTQTGARALSHTHKLIFYTNRNNQKSIIENICHNPQEHRNSCMLFSFPSPSSSFFFLLFCCWFCFFFFNLFCLFCFNI